MSKKFQNKPCVYCTTRASRDGDHVVSREFFLPEVRAKINFPKVPACGECNNDKSKMEHYLTAVLPFGGQHANSLKTLETMVPPRLVRNGPLSNSLKTGFKVFPASPGGGAVPFEGKRLLKYLEIVSMGLAFWHWKIYLPPGNCLIRAVFPTNNGRLILEELLNKNARDRVKGNLGEDVFSYEGAQAVDCPELTIWRMSLCGVVVGERAKQTMETSSNAYVFTGPKSMRSVVNLAHLFDGNH